MDHSSTKPVTRLRGPLGLPHQPHRWLPLTRRLPPIDYPGSPRRPLSPPGQHYAQAHAPQRPVPVQESSYLQLSSETAEFITQCQICGKPCQLADEPLWTTLATTIPSTIGAMAVSSAPHLPSGSFEWLTAGRVDPGSRVVVLCPTVAHCRAVASHGADVLAVHRDPDTAEKLNRIPGIMAVCGSPESLPLNSSSFDAVLVHQGFHELAPGLALPEIARVLRPGSVLGVSWLVRDDTVPWVKRLAALLRTVDENAMSGDYGTESVHELISSKYFPEDEHTTKRLWVPVNRDSLVAMAAARPAVRALDSDARSNVLTKVAALADDSAGTSGLRLPYQLECWRAWVNHDELTTPIRPHDDGLTITL